MYVRTLSTVECARPCHDYIHVYVNMTWLLPRHVMIHLYVNMTRGGRGDLFFRCSSMGTRRGSYFLFPNLDSSGTIPVYDESRFGFKEMGLHPVGGYYLTTNRQPPWRLLPYLQAAFTICILEEQLATRLQHVMKRGNHNTSP